MDIILETAYSDGFICSGGLDDFEILDNDTNTSEVDDFDLWSLTDGADE